MKLYSFLLGTFKISCICTTVFMVGYWLYKFERNEDLTSIEYQSLDKIKDMIYPEITICFQYPPFKNDPINTTNENNFHKRYKDFLMGLQTSESFYDLDLEYQKVTPNLFDHIENIWIDWKPGASFNKTDCLEQTNCPHFNFKNNYNGFESLFFMKCFGIEIKESYASSIHSVTFVFDERLESALNRSDKVMVMFNMPNQFLRPYGGIQSIWPNSRKQLEVFQITSVEIIKRRNTKRRPCSSNWKIYDKLIMKQHLENSACRTPYQSQYKNMPVCTTLKEMKKAHFEKTTILKSEYVHTPCQEMPYIDFKHNSDNSLEKYVLWFSYPPKAKFVKQLKDVDVHSLIGNIGGYIGLFLGKSIDIM